MSKRQPRPALEIVDIFKGLLKFFCAGKREDIFCTRKDLSSIDRKRIKVVGVGLGRSGTFALQNALTILGHNCYHMKDALANREMSMWLDAYRWKISQDSKYNNNNNTDGSSILINFDKFFAKRNYSAIVDEPGNRFYKELMQFYPNAKFILTTREFNSWHDSVMKTIYKILTYLTPHWIAKYLVSPKAHELINELTFGMFGGIDTFKNDKEYARSIFNKWNNDIISNISKDRLLIFDVKKHGWKELCNFLQIEIAQGIDSNYNLLPKVNSSKDLSDRIDLIYFVLKTIDIVLVMLIAFILIRYFL